MSSVGQRPERRDTSPAGKWYSEQFDASLILFHVLGLSDRVIEYCTQRARETQQLPHEVLVQMVEEMVLAQQVMQ